jgi:meiotic recombination protein REC8
MDDPAFLPDMALPALEFDLPAFSFRAAGTVLHHDSQVSSLEPNRTQTTSPGNPEGALGFDIPTSVGTGVSYQLPDPFGRTGSSAQKRSSLGYGYGDDDQAMIEEFDFEFDADGGIRDLSREERESLRTGIVTPLGGRPGDVAAARAAAGAGRRPQPLTYDDDGDFVLREDDGGMILPEGAEAFPPRERGTAGPESPSMIAPTEESTVTIEAAQRRRRQRIARRVVPDQQLELINRDLRSWQENYLFNMDAERRAKANRHAAAMARVNADNWVWGNGIGDLGRDPLYTQYNGPLGTFIGANLRELITGISSVSPSTPSPKRGREGDEGDEERRVRARDDDGDQIGRRGDDEGFFPAYDDSMPMEVGRDAPSALDDHPSSAMPWNVSASALSYRAHPPGTLGSSALIARSRLSARPGSRLTSASPLLGRERGRGTDIHGIERVDDFDDTTSPPEDFGLGFGGIRTSSVIGGLDTQAREFELFGPAAGVDTQTAASASWVREALARESMNFLDFVRNSIAEENAALRAQLLPPPEAGEEEEDEEAQRARLAEMDIDEVQEVAFGSLFPPEENSRMVASQAFLHVLSLATRNLVRVWQEGREDEEAEVWGEIWVGVKERAVPEGERVTEVVETEA